jgi:uncharacterized membrane protein
MATETSGPVDLVVLKFPGNQFNGEIGPAMRNLAEREIVRVLDILFVYKDEDGTVGSVELADLSRTLEPAFVDLDGQLGGGLLDAEDVEEVASDLEPGSSAALVVFENLWAIPFIAAVRSAGGELVDQARIPSDVVDAVRQEA